MAEARKRRKKYRERGAFDLLEEAFHALRVSSLSTLVVYYIGSVPFVVCLFYFWADMSRSSFALQDAALASLAVGGTYFWMKAWQAVFCQRLWVQLNAGGEVIDQSWGRSLRYLAAQVLIQSTAIPVLVLALICVFPLAWIYAFYQNVTALGLTQDYGRKPLRHLVADSARLSHWEWGSNHFLGLIVMIFSLFVWMSVIMMAMLLPVLAKSLLGVESVFTLNPVATFMNSTFIFGTLLIVFLCVSPLTKALYVIRCFYGQSRTTGADLMSRLVVLKSGQQRENTQGGNQDGGQSSGRRAALGKMAVLILILGVSANGLAQDEAEDSGSAGLQAERAVTATDFDSAVKETLQDKHFQWRLEREVMEDDEEGGGAWFG